METPLRRLSFSLLGLVLLSIPAQATWSIVCVNVRTREVGVATATCIPNLNLKRLVPVIFVGEGAAAAQSVGDQFGDNRRLIYFSFRDTEETPQEILARLAEQDPIHQGRQYGIVNFTGDPLTFTGNNANAAASGITGQSGDFLYAVQGNILVGHEVVTAAADAFHNTHGGMGERLMAAMHAARDLGGDGRCSCSGTMPTSCGVPPPAPFKSAHIGTVVVARQGDANGGCNQNAGCAKGDYYMTLNYIGDTTDPDPVFELQAKYDAWRLNQINAPDGHLSEMYTVDAMPADGVTQRFIKIQLRDIDGVNLDHGDSVIEVSSVDSEPLHLSVGDPMYEGQGRYRIPLTAGLTTGVDRLAIKATTDLVEATILPFLEIESVRPEGLIVGVSRLRASESGTLPFVLHSVEHPDAPFSIVGVQYPFEGALRAANVLPGASLIDVGIAPFYPSAPLLLDANGRAEGSLDVPAAVLNSMLGSRLEWTGVVLSASGPVASEPVSVLVTR